MSLAFHRDRWLPGSARGWALRLRGLVALALLVLGLVVVHAHAVVPSEREAAAASQPVADATPQAEPPADTGVEPAIDLEIVGTAPARAATALHGPSGGHAATVPRRPIPPHDRPPRIERDRA